jgi:hypothetical protein
MNQSIVTSAVERPSRATSTRLPVPPTEVLRQAIDGLIVGKDVGQNMSVLRERLGQAHGRGTLDVVTALMNSAQGGEIPRETLEKMLTFLPPKRDEKATFQSGSSFVFSAASKLSGAEAFVNY